MTGAMVQARATRVVTRVEYVSLFQEK